MPPAGRVAPLIIPECLRDELIERLKPLQWPLSEIIQAHHMNGLSPDAILEYLRGEISINQFRDYRRRALLLVEKDPQSSLELKHWAENARGSKGPRMYSKRK